MAVSRQNGFPLAALFLLVAGFALLLPGAASAVRNIMPPESIARQIAPSFLSTPPPGVRPLSFAEATGFLFCGGVLGAVIGAVAGCTAERWFRGAVLGFFTGGAVGVLSTMHLLVKPDLRAVAAGSAVVIMVSLIYRFKLKRPDEEVPIVDQGLTDAAPPGEPGK